MLEEEIEQAQRSVKTDAYQMSLGEIINMYKEGDLIINPDFQRLFRWGIGQKSKFIESILLGIPIPSIFVFETQESKWELIDGLQRISTILEFLGVLRDPDTNEVQAPSYLVETKYLPSLNNVVWEKVQNLDGVDPNDLIPLDKPQQLAIRRARIGVEILKKPSDNDTKYDLFQRLNAGGTPANPQELRNCIIIMVNADYFQSLKALAESDSFKSVLAASNEQLERQRHLEYACRFLVLTNVAYEKKLDVEEFIDEGMIRLAGANDSAKTFDVFNSTFALLNSVYGEDSFRRQTNGKPTGRVSLAAFECIACGIGGNIETIQKKPNPEKYVHERIDEFWKYDELEQFFTPGLRGTVRLQRTIPFGMEWFSK